MGEYGKSKSIEDYEILEELGRGGFATVYRARNRISRMEVAIKMIDKKLMETAGMTKRVREEIRIHSPLRHPSILRLYDSFDDGNYKYMVLELCENGDLRQYLSIKQKLSEQEGRLLLRAVVEGLKYLHSHKIVHRDISLANILLTKDNDVKISDFGLATTDPATNSNKKHMTMCGTAAFMSPEAATSSEQGPPSDVWSLGIVLYTVLAGYSPFDHKDGIQSTLRQMLTSDVEIPIHFSNDAKHLVLRLLQKEPKDRIPLGNILQHPFFMPNNISNYSSTPYDSHNRWLSYDSGLASSFQTSTLSIPISHQNFSSDTSRRLPSVSESEFCSSQRLPIINGSLRNQRQISYDRPALHLPVEHPCCNGHIPNNGNRRDDCSHCNPSSDHRHVCTTSSLHRCQQQPISISQQLPPPPRMSLPPLSSLRLQPIRQKTKNVIVNILENGEVCLEFTTSKDGFEQVNEVLKISPDGLKIVLYKPNRGRGIPTSTTPPTTPAVGAESFSYDNIPQKYWKKYSYAAKFVDLVKTKTPKVTFYSKSAKCFLMENGPDADFEACFYEGGKITKSGNSVKLIESNGECLTFDSTTTPRLSPSAQLMWEHFGKCLRHCKQIETSMSTLNTESEEICFPVTIGRRPSDYTRVLQSSSVENKENLSPTAPSAVNVRAIGGYEGSVVSASSKAGSGSGRRKKVIHEYDTASGGTVTQYSNGDISHKYADGSSIILNSTSPLVHYTTRSGQTIQYKETDPIPLEIRSKLTQLSEIVKALMPSAQR